MSEGIVVKWGSYLGFEGPYTHGSRKFVLPPDPSDNMKALAVLTATEGGAADAINGYDRCIMSGGLIQFCEAQYHLLSGLLGAIAECELGLMAPLLPAMEASGVKFHPVDGKWRFHKDGKPLTTVAEQQKLYLLNSNGLKGSWDEASKDHAKLWTICLAETLGQDQAIEVQVDYVASRLQGFMTKDAKRILFDRTPNVGWAAAMRAIYMSFAGNLPAVADRHLKTALVTIGETKKWSPEWCLAVIRELTFGPKIAIYPGRYNKVRPVVEKLYGIDLPDFASDLQQAKESDLLWDVQDIQEALIRIGYDLGPKGADGKLGPKTKTAIVDFQKKAGLKPDGVVGPMTKSRLTAQSETAPTAQ